MNNNEYPNWFEVTARANFERFLSNKRGLYDYRALQIGAYVGHASDWLCRNVLTGRYAHLDDVDTWTGSDEPVHKSFDWNDVYKTYMDRVAPHLFTRLTAHKQTSDAFFAAKVKAHGQPKPMYDFIYIDGDHTAFQTWKDGVNGWHWLKSGGIIAFDDYKWGEGLPEEQRPKMGIDKFLTNATGYTVLEMGSQVWIRKF